ncbi:hypothetical protein ACFE04_018072 [Oxalis oulophora]
MNQFAPDFTTLLDDDQYHKHSLLPSEFGLINNIDHPHESYFDNSIDQESWKYFGDPISNINEAQEDLMMPEIHHINGDNDQAGRAMEIFNNSHDQLGLQKCFSNDIEGIDGDQIERKKNFRPKRTRSAEKHNLYEKRRRQRMKCKIQTLQELIPNCHKSDKVSVLADAVDYLKAMKQQVDTVSDFDTCGLPLSFYIDTMRVGQKVMCQAPYLSQESNLQSQETIQFPQVMMNTPPGLGMGMCSSMGMFCPSGYQMVSPSSVAIPEFQPMYDPENFLIPQRPLSLPEVFPNIITPLYRPGFTPAATLFPFGGSSNSHTGPNIHNIDH